MHVFGGSRDRTHHLANRHPTAFELPNPVGAAGVRLPLEYMAVDFVDDVPCVARARLLRRRHRRQ